MEIKEIHDKQVWENFLSNIEEKSFLQSWNWGEFQKALGEKIWRLGIYDKKELVGLAMVIKIKAKRGIFLFAPHGPVLRTGNSKFQIPWTRSGLPEGLHPKQIQNSKSQILNILIEKLKQIAKEEKCGFIRVAALWERNEKNQKIFKDLGFRTAPIHMHPELTWELDITLSEEKLLANMRKTTRYLIKQGRKNKDLEIEVSKNVKDIGIFNELYQKTVNRHHFTPFSPDYLKKEFLAFLPDNEILLFSAKHEGECLASAAVIFWQGAAFYHQGASAQDKPKIPASYLVQWEAIREAKKRGCRTYNFWGIAPQKKHPWAGLTLFKTGFGGYSKEFLKTQDLPLSFSYWFSYLVEKIRKIKRNL